MKPRERILAVIDHKPVDKIPTDYWATPEVTERVMKELKVTNELELWKTLKIDKIINIQPKYIGPDFADGSNVDTNYWGYWGVKTKSVSYGNDQGTYYEIYYYPLEKYNSIEEIINNYTWPKADWFDFSCIEEECRKYPDYAIESGYMAPFYMYNNIRGLEENLIDLAINEEMAFYIIEKICDFIYEYHERLFEAANGQIDIAQVTDDFGTQQGLMIGVDMFDKYFKKQYRRFIKLVKNHGIRVFHHDDGAIMDIIPRMVDLGINVLNPIQWRLPGMGLKPLKERFGNKICFHGAVDNQKVLPFGSVEDVKKEVKNCLDILAADGTGYILAPCHNIQPNTPIENIKAMYKFANEYGREVVKN